MICEVYDYCPVQKDCENCPQWYKSYVKTCKEEGKEPTDMRPKQFHSYDVTPAIKGEDVMYGETNTQMDNNIAPLLEENNDILSYEEAAKELGIKVQTLQNYISKGRLTLAATGYVTKESVENYKKERLKNMAKVSEMIKTKKEATVKQKIPTKSDDCAIKTDNNQATVKQIKPIDEATKEDDLDTEYIVTKNELIEALKTAKRLGYEEGKAKCQKEKIDLKGMLNLIAS